jgi:hypothetical protein
MINGISILCCSEYVKKFLEVSGGGIYTALTVWFKYIKLIVEHEITRRKSSHHNRRESGKGIAEVFAKHGANVAFTYSSSVESLVLENELMPLVLKLKDINQMQPTLMKRKLWLMQY